MKRLNKDSITKAEHELPMENPYSNSMWLNKSLAFHFDRTEILKLWSLKSSNLCYACYSLLKNYLFVLNRSNRHIQTHEYSGATSCYDSFIKIIFGHAILGCVMLYSVGSRPRVHIVWLKSPSNRNGNTAQLHIQSNSITIIIEVDI